MQRVEHGVAVLDPDAIVGVDEVKGRVIARALDDEIHLRRRRGSLSRAGRLEIDNRPGDALCALQHPTVDGPSGSALSPADNPRCGPARRRGAAARWPELCRRPAREGLIEHDGDEHLDRPDRAHGGDGVRPGEAPVHEEQQRGHGDDSQVRDGEARDVRRLAGSPPQRAAHEEKERDRQGHERRVGHDREAGPRDCG